MCTAPFEYLRGRLATLPDIVDDVVHENLLGLPSGTRKRRNEFNVAANGDRSRPNSESCGELLWRPESDNLQCLGVARFDQRSERAAHDPLATLACPAFPPPAAPNHEVRVVFGDIVEIVRHRSLHVRFGVVFQSLQDRENGAWVVDQRLKPFAPRQPWSRALRAPTTHVWTGVFREGEEPLERLFRTTFNEGPDRELGGEPFRERDHRGHG